MTKPTIFDYAREVAEAEEKLLMLLEPEAEPTDKAEDEPAVDGKGSDTTPVDSAES